MISPGADNVHRVLCKTKMYRVQIAQLSRELRTLYMGSVLVNEFHSKEGLWEKEEARKCENTNECGWYTSSISQSCSLKIAMKSRGFEALASSSLSSVKLEGEHSSCDPCRLTIPCPLTMSMAWSLPLVLLLQWAAMVTNEAWPDSFIKRVRGTLGFDGF